MFRVDIQRYGANLEGTLVLFGVGTVAVVAAAAVSGEGGNNVDNEVWRWLWTVFAIIMGVGEVFTAGFFLLPDRSEN